MWPGSQTTRIAVLILALSRPQYPPSPWRQESSNQWALSRAQIQNQRKRAKLHKGRRGPGLHILVPSSNPLFSMATTSLAEPRPHLGWLKSSFFPQSLSILEKRNKIGAMSQFTCREKDVSWDTPSLAAPNSRGGRGDRGGCRDRLPSIWLHCERIKSSGNSLSYLGRILPRL